MSQNSTFISRMAQLRTRLAQFIAPGPPRGVKLYPSYGWGLHDETDSASIRRNYGAYVEEGFQRNAIIYSAIMYKAKASTAAPLRAYAATTRPELLESNDPLVQLINRPNAHQSGIEFQALNTVYLNLAGECFILLDRGDNISRNPDNLPLPQAMYSLRPDRVRMVVNPLPSKQYPGGRDAIKGWAYFPEDVTHLDDPRVMPILPEDMVHIVFPNPGDSYEGAGAGQSPIEPMARSGDVDNMVTDFLKTFFQRGAMFSGLLRFDAPMDEPTMARVRQYFMEVYGGYNNWSEVGVLDSGARYERIGLTFDEMGFESIDKRNGARIVMPFGVPAALIGDPAAMERATYNNLIELRRIFWEDTFLPEMRLFEAAYQDALLGTDTEKLLRFDTSAVPALSRDIPALIKAAHDLWLMGTPADAAFEFLNLPVPEYAGSDVSYIPINMVQVGKGWVGNDGGDPDWFGQDDERQPSDAGVTNDMQQENTENAANSDNSNNEAESASSSGGKALSKPITQPPSKDVDTAALKLAHKRLLGKALDIFATNAEISYRNAADEAFSADRRHILAELTKASRHALEQKQTLDYDAIFHAWSKYLDDDGEDNWASLFTPVVLASMQAVANYWMDVYDIELSVSTIQTSPWFESYISDISGMVTGTTKDFLFSFITQAKEEGWTYEVMRNHLSDVYDQWMDGELSPDDFEWLDADTPIYRLNTIVRTETMRAMNAGTYHLFRDWGAEYKEWIAVNDNRVRETHALATSEYTEGGSIGPIPYSEPFVVGGEEMMYPLDPRGSAKETCNCRCVSVPYIQNITI